MTYDGQAEDYECRIESLEQALAAEREQSSHWKCAAEKWQGEYAKERQRRDKAEANFAAELELGTERAETLAAKAEFHREANESAIRGCEERDSIIADLKARLGKMRQRHRAEIAAFKIQAGKQVKLALEVARAENGETDE